MEKMTKEPTTNQILMQKRQFALKSTLTLALVITIVVFATLIAYRLPWAFDMTAGKIFTLSEQSSQVVAALTSPVEVIAIYPLEGANPIVTSLLDE
jgi:uncharacterized membrane protein (DUF485 family)